MRIQDKYLTFISLFCITLSLSAQTLDYRWLEVYKYENSDQYTSLTHEQSSWLLEQDAKKEAYIEGLQVSGIETDIHNYWSESRVLKELKIDQDRAVQYVLDQGGISQSVILVNKTTKQKRKIVNSAQLQDVPEARIPFLSNIDSINLSPTKRYLLVSLTKESQTIYKDILIYDLEYLDDAPALLENTAVKYLVWEGEDAVNYRDYPSWYMFKYHFDSQAFQYLPDGGTRFRVIENTSYVYRVRTTVNENDRRKKTLFIKKNGDESALSVDATDVFNGSREEGYSQRCISVVSQSVVCTDLRRNLRMLAFFNIVKDEEGNDKLVKGLKFEAPLDGSIQKVFSAGNYHLAVYLSGVTKLYFVFNLEGKLIKTINAPHANLRAMTHKEGELFTLNFRSEVLKEAELTMNLGAEQPLNAQEIDETLYTDKEGHKYKVSFFQSTSKDGTQVPFKVVHKEEMEVKASSPLLIHAYGGHGIVTRIIPSYRIGLHSFLKRGGVFATPAVRGGGEFGQPWYTQVFNTLVRYEDTESVVRELHRRNIGSPVTTGFEGWSNGGLLAGVMLTRAPELFKLVIPGNGSHDIERRQVLQSPFAWIKEFGDARSKESVEYIRSYSPFYNADQEQEYPTVYLMVGGEDIRVNPSHSYKMAAILQDRQTGDSPIILDYYSNAGHWVTSPTYTRDTALVALKRKWRVISNELGLEN